MSWIFGSSSSSSASAAQTSTPQAVDEAAAAGCPVDHSTRSKWMQQQQGQDTSAGSDPTSHPFASPSSRPSASASATTFARPLSNERETSSIPRFSASSLEASATGAVTATSGKWVYPSPSQFYNALARKNRNPRQEDMDFVVPIHNAVNERTWDEVMKWENEALASEATSGPAKDAVQLVSFIGRPQDRTPRAWWKTLLGYQPPFDRHDWIIDREGKRIRYVIDFYTGRGGGSSAALPAGVPPQLAFYLDVRPAIDGFEGLKMRVRRNLNRLFGLGSKLERKDNA